MPYRVHSPQPRMHRPFHHEVSARSIRGFTISYRRWQFSLGPGAFWLTALLMLAMAVWSAGTATYFVFRDDLLTRLMARQVEMQYAYEDRIAELRAQMDRVTSRQLLDQEQIEQRIEHLARRQAVLENRSSALSGLPDTMPTGSVRPRPGLRSDRSLPGRPAPVTDTVILAPSPDRHAELHSRVAAPRLKPAGPGLAARLAEIEGSLDRVESQQSAMLVSIEDYMLTRVQRMRSVLADLGLDARQFVPPESPRGVGGPFMPVSARAETQGFERQLNRVELARTHVERLVRTLSAVPVRRPIDRGIETSSGFGVRLDPFLRTPAMHAGLDFRAPTGERVLATAAGTVTTAGTQGGYGRLVEIDHGGGITTRYAHLSEISVQEGDRVRPGQLIGLVGSTGRSTGPHLHYETRIAGEPVDPQKFLRAGVRLGDAL